jgi:hypothetical protein
MSFGSLARDQSRKPLEHGEPQRVDAIEYAEIPGLKAGDALFECAAYKCRLLVSACAKRFADARGPSVRRNCGMGRTGGECRAI